MDKDTVKELILRSQEKSVNLVERDIEVELGTGRANAFIGPRRAGKTFLMYQIMNKLKEEGRQESIIYINFEDERLYPIKTKDLQLIIESYRELFPNQKHIYLFLDEVQQVQLWEKFVRRMHDQGNAEVFITGSSSKLLSKEIATELRGRSLSHYVFPYSFQEFLRANNVKVERNFQYTPGKYGIKKMLQEYMKFGGFPELVGKNEEIRIRMLQEYYELIFYRDLVERYGIRNLHLLKTIMHLLASNFASKFSIHKSYRDLRSQGKKISKDTIYEYISYLEDINLFFLVEKFAYSAKSRSLNPKKVYCVDNGIITSLSLSLSEDRGKLLENLVFMELRRRGKDIFYWSGKRECDFLLKDGGKIVEAIQVTEKPEGGNRERELEGLLEAMEKFNLAEGTIITLDEKDSITYKDKKIRVVPVWKWLLQTDIRK